MATRWDGKGDGRAASSGGEAEDGSARRSCVIKPLNLRPRKLEIDLTSGEIPFLIECRIFHQERDSPRVCSWPCGAWRSCPRYDYRLRPGQTTIRHTSAR